MAKQDSENEIPLKNMGRIPEDVENQEDAETMVIDNRRKNRKIFNSTKWLKLTVLFLITIIAALLIAYFVYYYITKSNQSGTSSQLVPPDTEIPLPPSSSTLHVFENGAICSDSAVCSKIGRDILHRGGNVMDSALAALFCNGITTMQSLGLGGGFIMNIFIKSQNRSYTLDAREVAPLSATENMFVGKPKGYSMEGPQSIAVPGEVLGYWEAHKRFASMPWKELIEPSIKVCEDGFTLSEHMSNALYLNPRVKNDPLLRKSFVNERTGEYLRAGTLVKPPKELCNTYRLLATNGGSDFYNGSIAKLLAEDLKEIKSAVRAEDLQSYQVDWHESIPINLGEKTMYVVPPVGSGVILGLIMNILQGYNFSRKNLISKSDQVLTYHRFIEAYKHAFGRRSELGDLKFNNVTELVNNLTSKEYAENIRKLIDDNKTFTDVQRYGAKFWSETKHGTSHLSVLDSNGDAISVTSSVNYYFGSGHSGRQTGVIFNSGMDDFSTPGTKNYFDLPSSKPNFIQPRKRAMSSMTPTIVVGNDGEVKLIVGAAGGSKITTGVAWVIARVLWFGDDVKQAVDAPRIHHQLVPNEVQYEYGILKDVVDGLQAKGHKMVRFKERWSVVCGVFKNKTAVYANADFRKKGEVFGL